MRIGTITKLELIKCAKGHTTRISGCGAWKNKRKDKKLRRLADKETTNENLG